MQMYSTCGAHPSFGIQVAVRPTRHSGALARQPWLVVTEQSRACRASEGAPMNILIVIVFVIIHL